MATTRDQVGGMRRRLKIQLDSPSTTNDFGEPVPNWSNVIPTADNCVWAEIEDLTGREFFNGAQVQADVNCRIVIRGYSGQEITPDMRAVDPNDGDTVYNFASVRWLDGRRQYLEIMAIREAMNPQV